MASVVADFVELLAQNELLDRLQLHELSSWQQRYNAVPDLIQELLKRGWLTSFQVDRLNDSESQLVIGPYILLEELGKGGMGRVYKARHRRLERIVALKVIHPFDLSHPEAVRRFQREAKAIARLRHPNIVLLYDASEFEGLHFLALEYVQGIDLEKLLIRKGPLEVGAACDCIRQAALGLQHAHERGLVHRDIKPSNLLLTHDSDDDLAPFEASTAAGVLKILDLGLARFANVKAEIEKLSIDGIIVGTPDYLAPEQALDSSKVDRRADIYSLGCTFYELLTGQTPYATVQGTQKLIAHIQDEPPPLAMLRAGLPFEIVQIVHKMMAKNPADRFQTAAQVGEVLQDLSRSFDRAEPLRSTEQRARPFSPVSSSAAEPTGLIRFKRANAGLTDGAGLYTEQPRQLVEHTGPVYAAAFSPDGRFALTGGEDQAVCLWDMNAVRRVRRLTGHNDTVLALAFAPDSRHALSTGRDRNVILWDVETGQAIQRLRGISAEVLAVAFSPDGRSILTGGQDTTLALWERSSQKLIRRLGGLVRNRHQGPITSVCFTADSQRALSGSGDGTIRLWNVKTGAEVHCFAGHKDGVSSVAPSPDGLHVVSGGSDRAVRTWGLVSGEELTCSLGHKGELRGVAYAPDARHVLSVGETTLRVWELPGGREVYRSSDDVQKILCLAVSPDGRQVLTGGRDKHLCLWKRNE